MRSALGSCLVGFVFLAGLSILAQQPAKSTAPPKKASPAAKAAPKALPPPPAANAARLYPAFSGYDSVLLRRPPAGSPGSCLEQTDWVRKLEGDLTGTQYTISLKARSDLPRRRFDQSIREEEIPPGKIRASILLRRQPSASEPLPPHYVEKLREWGEKNAEAGAPPQPDPADYKKWHQWALSYGARPAEERVDMSKLPEAERMEASVKLANASLQTWPPTLESLDSAFRKQGLPARGEILLASAAFDTKGKQSLFTATLGGPDPEALPGDRLVLSVSQVEGYSCVATDSEGFVYIDIPSTTLTDSDLDAANRVYIITGTLVAKGGAPVAGKEVLFLPVDAEGNGLTTFGPPTAGGTMHMTNPRTKTNAQGRFTLRVAASFFNQSADPEMGRIQPVEPMGGGRLRHLGKGVDVRLTDKGAEQVNLGRVVVGLR